jgi:AcrR family transcriptional regulator
VGRSTFYAHFADKDDLTRRIIGEHLRTMQSATIDRQAEPEAYGFAFSRPMFEHARAFRPVHRALIGDAGEAMHEEFHVWMMKTVRREIIARNQIGTVPVEFTVHFVVGAFLAVLSWWLDKEPERSVDEVEAMFQGLVLGGAAAS